MQECLEAGEGIPDPSVGCRKDHLLRDLAMHLEFPDHLEEIPDSLGVDRVEQDLVVETSSSIGCRWLNVEHLPVAVTYADVLPLLRDHRGRGGRCVHEERCARCTGIT